MQAALVARGVESTLVTFRTRGDKHLDEPLAAIGAKGLFTKEIETALLKRKIDLAVHSLKDVSTELPDGLVVSAVLERGDPRDALVISAQVRGASLDDLPRGSRVGTSSLHRRAQLLARRPDLDVAELRGDLPTQLKKVDDGRVHAAILGAAALHHLDAQQHITCYLDAPDWLPAAGEGTIAVQVRDSDAAVRAMADPLNHEPTMRAVRAERAFLAALEGGSQVPIGALVVPEQAAGPTLHGFIADMQGERLVRGSIAFDNADPELSGIRLANELRGKGASEILEGLRRATRVPRLQPE